MIVSQHPWQPKAPGPDEQSEPGEEFERVSRWREEQLLAAGYEPYTAHVLSRLHDVDLHVACDMLRHGAREDLAIEILL